LTTWVGPLTGAAGARSLIRQLFRTEVDLIPDRQNLMGKRGHCSDKLSSPRYIEGECSRQSAEVGIGKRPMWKAPHRLSASRQGPSIDDLPSGNGCRPRWVARLLHGFTWAREWLSCQIGSSDLNAPDGTLITYSPISCNVVNSSDVQVCRKAKSPWGRRLDPPRPYGLFELQRCQLHG